jgi:thiol-disulfide isomerase/thioredoxin
MKSLRFSFLIAVIGAAVSGGLVDETRDAMAKGNFAAAERIVEERRASIGTTPEFAQAVSWLARGALTAKNYDSADRYASEARKLAIAALGARALDSDPFLPGAIGNAIDVHAQVLNARGDAAAAVAYLRTEFATYGKTSIAMRIQKTVNVISLEGKPAPALDATEWIGTKPPTLASMKGKPVLLFFWAHWCPDCKAEAPVIAKIMQTYGPQGLALVAPTRYYGYTAANENATPQVEKPYIEKIQKQYYAALGNPPTPLSNANAVTYGMASTPTLALVDRAGIVRWYHPGAATEQEIAARVEAVLK